MALKNLIGEMAREEVKVKDISEAVGRSQETVRNWISGRTDIPVGKAIEIKEKFFPMQTIDYLYRQF